MKTIDLHVHSYYSDGAESPSSLCKIAIRRRFSVFSIADHNYISPQQSQIQKIALRYGIFFIQGIEISSIDRIEEESLHILGYSRAFNIPEINKVMKPIVEGYNERAKKIIDKINSKYNAHFDYNLIEKEVPGVYISRNQLAERLSMHLGGKYTAKELVPEIFVEENNSWMPSVQKAIEIIRENNGMAVLAHPQNLLYKDNFDNLIKRLTCFGLEGIETYTPKHDSKTIDILNFVAKKFGLIMTAGSDWHGSGLSPMGRPGLAVPDRVCTKLLNRFGYKETLNSDKTFRAIGLTR